MNDGGPAFPVGSGDMRDPTGLTLRDYFAAKAMQGMCANTDRDYEWRDMAITAYELADAMIAEREGKSK